MEENENVSENEEMHAKKKSDCGKNKGKGAPSGAVYGLGFIGAAIYYLSVATGFWMGVLGILKAIIWPVLLVYETLKFLAK
jgi:hypothetical protein